MQKLSLKDCSVKGKKVLIRSDFNVPLDKSGRITDDTRIVSSLPTIQYVLDQGGSVVLMSHLGRPKHAPSPECSLRPVAARLGELLRRDVLFADDCIGDHVEELVRGLKAGEVLLLENLRFHEAEEAPEKDPFFAKKLAAFGDIYVNDAFGTAHRAHASTATIAQYFPGKAAAGFLMEKEIAFLGSALGSPRRPFLAIIGGAKVSSKIGVLKALIKKVDILLIGGGMSYTFFKAQGIDIGDSIHEDAFLEEALEVIACAKSAGVTLQFPVDHVVESADGSITLADTAEGLSSGSKGVDIGPKTVSNFINHLHKAKTVFWNGPLGIFEDHRFDKGTLAVARALPSLDAVTVVGGGDSVAALQLAGVADAVSHVSTGGGASLEYVEQGTLPGIEALTAIN